MKKLVTLLLAAGLVFSAANGASAVEVKASGTWDFAFDHVTNKDFVSAKHGGGDDHHFGAVQRMRIGMQFIASENLSATYQAQVGTFTWGGPSAGLKKPENQGGALGTRSNNIVTRLAYLDWMVPNTDVKVRMGQQVVAMPSFVFGSPVLDDTATGIVVAAPVTENIGVTAGWLRAESDPRRGTYAEHPAATRWNDNIDLFTLVGDFNYDGVRVSPWALLGPVGKATSTLGAQDGNNFVWFAGISGELTMFDPFRFALDFYYSALDAKHSDHDRSGWYVAGSAEYATAYGTPGLKAWYASGDDKKTRNGSEQPLTLSGAFNPTISYFDGVYGIGNNIDRCDASGTWGVGLYWNGLSFVEDLTHDFAVVYFQGTNSKHLATANPADPDYHYLTTKDSAVELDFVSTYQIYENLATALELSYIFQDFDKNIGPRNGQKFDDNFRATLNFRYTF